jgi:histidyl-tRNA synthetase
VSSTKPPGGTRDFLPDAVRRRDHVIGVIRGVYERYGFEPLETPAFENIETLLGKYGEEGNRLIFKILRRGEHERTGEADLALRYDLTVPLARVVAQYQNELPRFFKRYQIQPVWRADRPAKGRFREFYQCDIDTIGSTSPVVEVEQLSAVIEVFTSLGFSDFVVWLNHRELLRALLDASGIARESHADALIALDKLDKIGREGVTKELVARGVGSQSVETCLAACEDESVFDRLVANDPDGVAAAQNVRWIFATLQHLGLGRFVQLNPRLARGLSYYTGAIMEVAVPDLAGSLGGGGRYDNLIGMFLGRDVPACGFSLGLERIIVVMSERHMFPADVAGAGVDVLVTIWNDQSRCEAMALASALRRGGLRVDVYPEADKLVRQFKYASSRNVPFVTILGDDERARGEVAIKDLRSGEQVAVPVAETGTAILARLRQS